MIITRNAMACFYMIFGHAEALGFLYLLTGFLAVTPSGKRENERHKFIQFFIV